MASSIAPLEVPEAVAAALDAGATLAISISGGKDSQALIVALAAERHARGWSGPVYAVHADLGRAEWAQSLGHCRRLAAEHGMELVVVRRPGGDLVQQIEERAERLAGEGKPAWPDARNRYCTSDQKRAQIDKVVRNPWPTATMRYCTADQKRGQIDKTHRGGRVVVAAMGFRADESAARSKRAVCGVNQRTTSRALVALPAVEAVREHVGEQGLTLDWLPIHRWSVEDVWRACGTSAADLARRQALYRSGRAGESVADWPCHPAYVFGNERVSCSLCVLASRNDLIVGARHNPELVRTYVGIEDRSGFTFRKGLSLRTIAAAAGVTLDRPAGAAWRQLELGLAS